MKTMFNSNVLNELNKAFASSPKGFLVVDNGVPRFAVLPFSSYQLMKTRATPALSPALDSVIVKKVLITGGAGYIGSHTVRILEEQGVEVVVYDNLSTGREKAIKNSRLIVGDLSDRKKLSEVFSKHKFDAVIHFVAFIETEESVINPAKYYENNVVNGLNLLEAMVAHKVYKIVFSSSAAVYGEPKKQPVSEEEICQPANPYGETKYCFENILKSYGAAYGVSSVSLRYFNAAGAWPEEGLGYAIRGGNSHLIPRVLNVAAGKEREIGVFGQDYDTADGTCIRDYIHVLDLAEAHILALTKLDEESGNFVYNVGTGRGFSVLEVIDKAMEVTGKMIPMSVKERRAGDPSELVADSGLIQKELGWKPKYGLQEILQSSWEWHKKLLGS